MNIGFVINLCALFLFISLIFSLCYRNKLWSEADKVFLLLVIVCTLCTAADLVSVSTNEGGMRSPYWILYGSSYFYFVLRNITPFIYVCYIVTLTQRWGIMVKKPLFLTALLLPLLIAISLIFTNPWTKGVFYYDKAHVYHRGHLLVCLYFIAVYYMLYSLIDTYRYRELINREKRYAIFSFVPVSMGSVLFQMLYPAWVVEMFATAVCIMLIMFTLQKKEEVMEGSTGLWNRAAFIEAVGRYFGSGRDFCIISVRISNLKQLSGTIGLTQTEKVLADIVQYIKQYRSVVNGLYVTKGGHFDLILCGKRQEKKEETAREINEQFKKPWLYQGLELNLIVYVAISDCPADFKDKDELLYFTDTFHKSLAFGGQVLYAGELQQKKLKREDMEQVIENAWSRNGFEVYYQPIYCVEEERFKSAEALLRLHDEKHGFIPPDEFIPVAEANTSILKIGQFVLEKVCAFIAANNLKEKGIDFIEINLSAVQCIQADIAEKIISTVESYGIDPSQINFEVTETAAINSPDIMLKNMEKLEKRGIRFSLDDFGSGYSNINYLLNFPFSIIKLDREIIAWESRSEKSLIALKYSIKMIREMGFKIVAEGMENAELADFLTEKGCDYQQGYYFSKPLPGDAFLTFLAENKDGFHPER